MSITSPSARGMRQAMHSIMLNRPDLTAVLADVCAPTVLLVAVDDPTCTPASARAAVGHLPNGVVVEVPGAGHLAPLLVAGSTVADLICDFWREPATVMASARATVDTPAPRPSV